MDHFEIAPASSTNTIIKDPSCWNKRTLKERLLLIILAIAIISVFILLAILYAVLSASKDAELLIRKERNSCTSSGCIHAAARVLKYMDKKVDPCDDFYKFSCGNFISSTHIPEESGDVTMFSQVNDLVLDQIKLIIENPPEVEEFKYVQLVKKLYRACMDKTAIESLGWNTIYNIKNELNDWPVVKGPKWNKNTDWKKVTFLLNKRGLFEDSLFTSLVDFSSDGDKKIISLEQPFLGIEHEVLSQGWDDRRVIQYHQELVDTAVFLRGAPPKYQAKYEKRASKELKKAIDFEIELAKIMIKRKEVRDPRERYNTMSIAQLQKNISAIDWLDFLNNLFHPHIILNENDTVNLMAPSYFENFISILERTPIRDVANYMVGKAVMTLKMHTNEALEPRSRTCVSTVVDHIPIASGALYITNYFDQDSKLNAREIVEYIQEEFRKTLRNTDWMDEKTKRTALRKTDNMKIHIGYPDELLNSTLLDDYYKDLELDGVDFIRSMLNVTLFEFATTLKTFRLPLNKSEWFYKGAVAQTDAYYLQQENGIDFYAGVLQDVFFDVSRPRYMNFAAIGSIIGHEITHAFDDQGRRFNENGSLAQWWTKDTEQVFLRKARDIVHQYSAYHIPEINRTVNGEVTQGENIADNGGLKQAYRAYQAWIKANPDVTEKTLPGLSAFTFNQMFWISAANIWCAKNTLLGLQRKVTVDTHAPQSFRVLGPFSNSDHFAKDFNCPVGSKMNPKKKYAVW